MCINKITASKKIMLIIFILIFLAITAISSGCTQNEYYLMVHFIGNGEGEEAVYYALSTDGYIFTELNAGQPVLKSTVGFEGLRDPFIFMNENGEYILLATDMKAVNGWRSNHAIVTYRSNDLVNWTDQTLIEITQSYDILKSSYCAWAPQAIYDKDKGEYMIYFTACYPDTDDNCIYFAYTSDFKTLTSEPAVLYSEDKPVIDADIIEDNGMYYMFYKATETDGIRLVSSSTLSSGYGNMREVIDYVGCEGSNAYKVGKKWIITADMYWAGNFIMVETEDFISFTKVNTDFYSFDFVPRHGYVIKISGADKTRIMRSYSNS